MNTGDEICWACRRGLHKSCAGIITSFQNCFCSHKNEQMPKSEMGEALAGLGLGSSSYDSSTTVTSDSEVGEDYQTNEQARKWKTDDAVTDQQSTGRKRAAELYPLKDADGKPLPCDYAGKSNCLPNFMEVQIDGCGVRPGTKPGEAKHRHHHNYNTLDNDRTNIALLCIPCHNLLHARNDPHKARIYHRIYGVLPDTEDLKHANKALKSGEVSGGTIKPK